MFETKHSPALPLAARLEGLRTRLATLDESAAIELFQLSQFDGLLKTTISLCPDCLAHVPALVFTRGGKVFMRKICDHHGHSEAVLENDEDFYHLSNKDRWGRRFAMDKVMDFPAFSGGCCDGGNEHEANAEDFADQMGNKSCTILAEVTNACNLACPVCYSDARGDRKMPLGRFKEHMLRLIERKGVLDSVQLTGGEAVLHPEFWEMVAFLHGERVKKIYLPTNGIAFADANLAACCAPFRDKLMVLLQFDGRQPETNRAMRDANTSRVRDQVIENFGLLGIHMQLTMTITRDVNDHEIGWVVETGLRHPQIKVVALQPVTYSGRYELAQDPLRRLTLSDCVKAVVAQIHRRASTEDFKPIPCSHPNCGWITLFVQRFGVTANISRHIDLDQAMNRVSNRTMRTLTNYGLSSAPPRTVCLTALGSGRGGNLSAPPMFLRLPSNRSWIVSITIRTAFPPAVIICSIRKETRFHSANTTPGCVRAIHGIHFRRSNHRRLERRDNARASCQSNFMAAAAVQLIILMAVFTVVEGCWPSCRAHKWWRRPLVVDLCSWMVHPISVSAGIALAAASTKALLLPFSHAAFLSALSVMRERVAALPLLVQIVMATVVADFLAYWMHRAYHHFSILWAFHIVHHTSNQLDWLSTSRLHPASQMLNTAVVGMLLIGMGLPVTAVVAANLFIGAAALLVHANVKWSFGPFQYLFVSPLFHQWHHARLDSDVHDHGVGNFGAIFSIWDRLFVRGHCLPRTGHFALELTMRLRRLSRVLSFIRCGLLCLASPV